MQENGIAAVPRISPGYFGRNVPYFLCAQRSIKRGKPLSEEAIENEKRQKCIMIAELLASRSSCSSK